MILKRVKIAFFGVLLIATGECLGDDLIASTMTVMPNSGERSLEVTKWPIVFSHAWSRTAETSFQGDVKRPGAEYDHFGIKQDLESLGATVFQPNKLAYASHEKRGRLLYKKCAGTTVSEILCQGSNPEVIDGIHHATLMYCSNAGLRGRHEFVDEASCRSGMKFNIICHSQGCPDSRYMLSAVRNEFSGELMYKHVVSWTSMAGANKGTSEADKIVNKFTLCLMDMCRPILLDIVFFIDSIIKNKALITTGSESVIALSRKYMLETMDVSCDPKKRIDCAPSFNEIYHLPVDPEYPVLYQTFVAQINDINHPCFRNNRKIWKSIMLAEGENDGYISVESQQFLYYGPGQSGGATPVISRIVSGSVYNKSYPHPGLNHMAFNDSDIPGLEGVSCEGENNENFYFSRIQLYRNIVSELAALGF